MSEATHIVAIDGPAGAGKSTVARRAAKCLHFAFLDTGAMYRAATWWAVEQGIDLDDPERLAKSTEAMDLVLEEVDEGMRVFVNGQDVSLAIRTPEITRLIFKLDQNSDVRKHLVMLQRAFGSQRPTVAEGRDIGTVVFPQARCKIYMDASLEIRARRRAGELAAKGIDADMDRLMKEIEERDRQSMTRKDSPLRRAEDAILLDTTALTVDQVIDRVVQIAREKLCV